MLLLALSQLLDSAIDPDVETGDDCKGDDTEEDKTEPAVIERIVKIVETKISREVVGLTILIIQNLTLQKLWTIEQDGEHGDRDHVLEEAQFMRGHVLDDLIVVMRPVDGNEPLQSDSDCCQDGSRH